MLPENFSKLLQNFIDGFDAERPQAIEFRRAGNQDRALPVADPRFASDVTRSWVAWDRAAIVKIGQNLRKYLDERTRFIWEKSKEIVSRTSLPPYPELASDLKTLVGAHFGPTHKAAEKHLEDVRQSADIPSGYTAESRVAFGNILTQINAEVDLFCAEYETSQRKLAASLPSFNIGTVYGPVGNVRDSHVSISDYSSLQQPSKPELLKSDEGETATANKWKEHPPTACECVKKATALRHSLSEFEQSFVGILSDAYLATGKGIQLRIAHSRFGKEQVRECMRKLSWRVFWEVEMNGYSYEPNLLGMLVAPNGQATEQLALKFVEYLELLFREKPEQTEITNRDAEQRLGLSKEESIRLYRIIFKAELWSVTGQPPSAEGIWNVGVWEGADDLHKWESKRDFVCHRAVDKPEWSPFQAERGLRVGELILRGGSE